MNCGKEKEHGSGCSHNPSFRYLIIGGAPVRSYTGTTSFAGIRVVARLNTLDEVRLFVESRWDNYGGLMLALDAMTGKEV